MILTSEEVQHKMAKCEFCDKGVAFGIQVSHSHRRSNRTWKPNVKRVKVIVDGTPKHAYACTRCLRSGRLPARSDPECVKQGSPHPAGLLFSAHSDRMIDDSRNL